MDGMDRLQLMEVSVYSSFLSRNITLPAYYRGDGSLMVLHSGLKQFLLNVMKDRVSRNAPPVSFSYQTMMATEVHCVVNCTVSMEHYAVTETGESSIRTLYTETARDYPYLEAQKRAFDRAVISFFQLQLDGKRVYSEKEFAPGRS